MSRPVTLFTGQWADLPLAELAPLASEMGYDGLELACWGDHVDVVQAADDPAYAKGRALQSTLRRPQALLKAIRATPGVRAAAARVHLRAPGLWAVAALAAGPARAAALASAAPEVHDAAFRDLADPSSTAIRNP